jgi:HK97 family phage prohead protease/HK97 family phage major capsid protein
MNAGTPYEFVERIEPGAFANIGNFDVRLLWGHDKNQVLARSNKGQGSLKLEADDHGLRFETELPDTQLGRDAYELVKRGDVSGASFGFVIGDKSVDKTSTPPSLTIRSFSKILEVSLTAFPANPTTSVTVRSEIQPTQPNIQVMENEPIRKPHQERAADTGGGMAGHKDRKALKTFSIQRAALMALGEVARDGVEAEVMQQGELEMESMGLKTRDSAAFHFPPSMIPDLIELRNQTVTGGTSGSLGGVTVQTSVGNLIDLFLPNPVIARCGAQVITGLRDKVDFPVEKTTYGGGWYDETGEVTYEDVEMSKRALSPKRMGFGGSISRQLLTQNVPDVEALMIRRMREAADRLFDIAAINGTGLSNQPLGILKHARSATPTLDQILQVTYDAANAYQSLINGEVGLAERNALSPRACYLGGFALQGILKNTKIDAGSGRMVLEGLLEPQPKTANGYSYFASNLVPLIGAGSDEPPLIFGDFSEGLILATWGTPTMIVDPYSQKKKSLVDIHLEQFADVLVRKPDAFVVFPNTDATT